MFLLFYLRHQIYLIIYNINTVTLAVIAIITQSVDTGGLCAPYSIKKEGS